MNERVLYLDWLRVIAITMVVTIHISGGIVQVNYFDAPTNWLAANFYESISRSAVSLFVMISGAVLLGDNREFQYKPFFTKRMSKLFIPLIGWSMIYYGYQVFAEWYPSFSLKEFIVLFLTNGVSGHFWFMYMMIGLYLTVPIINVFIRHAKKRDIEYFLILWIYASVIVKSMKFIWGYSFSIELYMVTNYIGYFVLGYYLHHFPLKRIWEKTAIVFGGISIFVTFVLTYYDTKAAGGILQEFWYENHAPNVLLSSIGIFLLCKNLFAKRKLGFVFHQISRLSYGIYLVHILLMTMLSNKIIVVINELFHPAFSIPLHVVIFVTISCCLSFLLNKIPFLRKLVS
ncbi:acyltransferase [Niallia endozanthoxylica]|uniref:Acyltransferase family protein n=1 Tax=Niallia endozanthoxylica TaxID=2036016 RepID=A0A5J5HQ59_9BACI|nr:acyltransferase family protein [Niallia endozanthoxylica]KAA9022279.1 acyltransferase family protein [Niallia endozanthoxylica]